MNGDAEHDHLHGIEYAGLVLELVSKRQFGKAIHGGEPLAVLVLHERAPRYVKPKTTKSAFQSPAHHLRHDIGTGRLAGGSAQLEREWTILAKGTGRRQIEWNATEADGGAAAAAASVRVEYLRADSADGDADKVGLVLAVLCAKGRLFCSCCCMFV